MDTESEIQKLHAETLALNIILSNVLHEFSKDPALKAAMVAGFRRSADIAEHTAIMMGKFASPDHTVKAMRIIEELRTVVLGEEGKPKAGSV
jgi:hypothetical protein